MPGARHRLGSTSDSSLRRNHPYTFASSSSPLTRTSVKPASLRERAQVPRGEGVHVDEPLERAVGVLGRGRGVRAVLLGAARIARRHAGSTSAPTRFGIAARRSPWRGRLAHEGERPARGEHAVELRHRAVEAGQVVQHRVAEHEVERPVLEGQRSASACDGLDLEAELLRGRRRAARSIPGEMSVATACSITPARSRLSVK